MHHDLQRLPPNATRPDSTAPNEECHAVLPLCQHITHHLSCPPYPEPLPSPFQQPSASARQSHVSDRPLPVSLLQPLLAATCDKLQLRSRPNQLLPVPGQHSKLGQSLAPSSPKARRSAVSQMRLGPSLPPTALPDGVRYPQRHQIRHRTFPHGLWMRLSLLRHVNTHHSGKPVRVWPTSASAHINLPRGRCCACFLYKPS